MAAKDTLDQHTDDPAIQLQFALEFIDSLGDYGATQLHDFLNDRGCANAEEVLRDINANGEARYKGATVCYYKQPLTPFGVYLDNVRVGTFANLDHALAWIDNRRRKH